MKITTLLLAATFAALCQQSYAGFVLLPNNATPVFGDADPGADPLYIAPNSTLVLPPPIVRYNLPASLVQLAATQTTVIFRGAAVGKFYDYVFRDTTTNKLVFGSKLELTPGLTEINDIFRSGFAGYSPEAARTFGTNIDQFVQQVARTATGIKSGALVYDPNVVAFRSDLNDSEGNPYSSLELIRTTATNYSIQPNVVRLRQGGEEGQPVDQVLLSGYAPAAAAPATVPLPGWALLVMGLAIAGIVIRQWRPVSPT